MYEENTVKYKNEKCATKYNDARRIYSVTKIIAQKIKLCTKNIQCDINEIQRVCYIMFLL